MATSDPYRYFRIEARELLEGMTSAALGLERGDAQEEHLGRILRQAHTLKGAGRVVRHERIAKLAHEVEGVLADHRGTSVIVSRERVEQVLKLLDQIAFSIAALEPTHPEVVRGVPGSIADEGLEGLRAEQADIDGLLLGISETRTLLAGLQQSLSTLSQPEHLAGILADRIESSRPENFSASERESALGSMRPLAEELRLSIGASARALASRIEATEREVGQLYDRANRLRLMPASTIAPTLQRVARDAARALGKRVDFRVTGGGVRMEAPVLEALRPALMQAVRNAVAHGIESEADRLAAGKTPNGCVRFECDRRGHHVVLRCQDDGRGIDVAAVQRAAATRGLLPNLESEPLDIDRAIQLLLKGGVSTSPTVTELSGRGIGLDVIRETAATLRGTVEIRSEPGLGTTVEIDVPVSLTAIHVLVVESAGTCVSIPIESVCAALYMPSVEFIRTGEVVQVPCLGRVIPFVSLASALSGDPDPTRKTVWSVLVLRAGSRMAALGVDRMRGTSNVVVQALPPLAAAEPIAAGASFDAEGNPQLLLDPGALIAHAIASKSSAATGEIRSRPPILVVDDSLTTRMLEQSILESAGYEVELATSGEEALKKAKERRYGLFVVDVEMPGMSGFELVEHTRADPAMREIPTILVTSRNSPEDRRRGATAGARAYIVKGEFNQEHLLSTIQQLIG